MAKKKQLTASEMGRKGGKSRAKNLTTQELADIGRKGAQKRWANNPGKKGGR